MRSSTQTSVFDIADLDLACSKLGYDHETMKSVQSLLLGGQPTMNELVHLTRQRGEAFLADPRSARSNWTIQQREETVFNEAVEDCLIRPPPGGWELLSEALCGRRPTQSSIGLASENQIGEGSQGGWVDEVTVQ